MHYKMVGMMNQHLSISLDKNNVSSTNNSAIFGEILEGNFSSPQFDYLINLGSNRLSDTKSIKTYNESNLAAQINNFKELEEITDDVIFLEKKPIKIKTKLVDALEKRHSTRQYSNIIKMDINELSTLLLYSYGVAKHKENYFGVEVTTRYHGSGGGLYPVDVYLLINNVTGINPGIYKYQPISHSLKPVSDDFDIEKLYPYGNFDLENYAFCALYEYDVNRNYVKYGELSLMVTFIEAGLMAQNLDLVAESMGFSTCQAAGYNKKYADKILGIDGIKSGRKDICKT